MIEEDVQPACHDKNAYRRFPKVMTGHRSYHSEIGRWLSRDPIGEEAFFKWYIKNTTVASVRELREQGRIPLYLFVQNNPVNSWDQLGLKTVEDCWKEHQAFMDWVYNDMRKGTSCLSSTGIGLAGCTVLCLPLIGTVIGYPSCWVACMVGDAGIGICCAMVWAGVAEDAASQDRETTCDCMKGASDFDPANTPEYGANLHCDWF